MLCTQAQGHNHKTFEMGNKTIDPTKDNAGTVAQAQPKSSQTHEDKGQKYQVLVAAIETAQPARLRSVLKNLCAVSDATEKYVSSVLLTPEITEAKSRKRSASAVSSEVQDGNKRFRPRYAMCAQCGTEYDVTLNFSKACQWHSGKPSI
jgi:hypothetical protein